MNKLRKLARNRLFTLALAAGLLAGACVPIRMESKWPSVSVIGPEKNLMLAYHERLVLVDVRDGTPVKLRNADGEVRLDNEGNPRIWEFAAPDGQPTSFYSAPVLTSSNQLLVATYHNKLFEIDLPTARPTSTEGINLPGAVLSDPVLVEPDESVDIPEAYVIFSTITNSELLVAFTAQNGERRWSYGR